MYMDYMACETSMREASQEMPCSSTTPGTEVAKSMPMPSRAMWKPSAQRWIWWPGWPGNDDWEEMARWEWFPYGSLSKSKKG